MKFVSAAILNLSLAGLLSCALRPQISAASPIPPFISNNQATKIIGNTVENVDGEKLGKVKDFVIAMPSGRLEYVIVTSGGFLGIDSHSKVVPAAAFSIGTAKKRTASLDLNLRRWKDAPQFNRKQLSQLADPKRREEIAQYYGAGVTRVPKANQKLSATPAATGRSTAQPAATLRLTSDLIGRRVTGSHQENLGVVADLLIDPENQKPTFAIISSQRPLRKDLFFALTLSSLRSVSSTRFISSITPATLDQARGFDATIWAAPDARQVYQYILKDADNTAWNADNRRPGRVTAADQSAAERDLQITRRVRQELIKEKALTLTAKNVKVITINGRVTLRGPVKLPFEKTLIQQKAELIAGAGRVDNQLEVETNP